MYVLYVRGGSELTVVEELRRKNITAYCPRQIKAERRRGQWQYAERIIFTGYVFVDIPELTAKLWHIVMKCSLHITDGFMTNLDHEIVKFNRRGRRASADVTLYGEKHRIVFSVEFDDPPALP